MTGCRMKPAPIRDPGAIMSDGESPLFISEPEAMMDTRKSVPRRMHQTKSGASVLSAPAGRPDAPETGLASRSPTFSAQRFLSGLFSTVLIPIFIAMLCCGLPYRVWSSIISSGVDGTARCRKEVRDYYEKIRPLLRDFDDAVGEALLAKRNDVAPTVYRMENIRRQLREIHAPDCVALQRDAILDGMEKVTDAFRMKLAGADKHVVEQNLNIGITEIDSGSSQLVYISVGWPTPSPRLFLTRTPVPTGTPTPTETPIPAPVLLHAGERFVLSERGRMKSWEVRVLEVSESATIRDMATGLTERASGRFVIVALEITNADHSSDLFSPHGMLEVEDSSGRRFQLHLTGAVYERASRGADDCGLFGPGETGRCVLVYDIPVGGEPLLLVPGPLADPRAPRVRLDLP